MTAGGPPPLHLRGVVLPDGEHRDLWACDGVLVEGPVAGAVTVVDGGWLLPGLVDAHCHIGIDRGEVPVADVARVRELALVELGAGVLALRDAGSPTDYAGLVGDPSLPHLVRAGRHVAAPQRYLRGYAAEVDADGLPAEIRRQAARGDGWVKIVGDWIDRERGDLAPSWDDAAVLAAVAAAHAAGARVAVHTFSTEALPGLLAAGVDSVEHGTGLTTDLVDALAASGAALVPTLTNVLDSFEGIADAGRARFPRYADRMRSLRAGFPAVVAAAHEAGVPLYVGTDAGGSVTHGQAAREVRLLHGCGVPAEQAVAAGSWAAREWLGLPGMVEGAPADVVAYPRDPRTDLSVLDEPTRVVRAGRVVA